MPLTIHIPGRKQFLSIYLLFLALNSYSQNVGIGTSSPHSSAIVDINSTEKGALLPRMTTTQRNAISNPAVGLLVFDVDKNALFLFIGNSWQALSFSSTNNFPPLSKFASDPGFADNFGYRVSLSGDYAIISAYKDDIVGKIDQGSVYIFKRSSGTWSEQTKLVASDGSDSDFFGSSVSISGDYAIVGAIGDDTAGKNDQGSAYIFHRIGNSWIQQSKLWSFDGAAGDIFGNSVTISGNYAIVGAPWDDVGPVYNQGSVYVFVFNGIGSWDYKAKLYAIDGQEEDYFGTSVAMSGSDLFIGAPQRRGGPYLYFGAVYHFWDDGGSGEDWYLQGKLTASDGVFGDSFGYSVSIDGSYLIIGAPHKDVFNGNTKQDQGAAYIFFQNAGTWTQQMILSAADGAAFDSFGSSVSISGNYAIVGVLYDDAGNNTDQGSAYIFKRNGTLWSLIRKVEEFNGSASYFFGASVAINGYNVIIGSYGNNSSAPQAGSVSFLNIE